MANKFIGCRNEDIPVDKVSTMIKRLHRAPIIEPDGTVVTMRSRGLQSGLIGFVRSCEDFVTQFSSIRAELEYTLYEGSWFMKQLGTLADDCAQSGSWGDLDALLASRQNSFEISGLEIELGTL